MSETKVSWNANGAIFTYTTYEVSLTNKLITKQTSEYYRQKLVAFNATIAENWVSRTHYLDLKLVLVSIATLDGIRQKQLWRRLVI